jgi:hypothetical protein
VGPGSRVGHAVHFLPDWVARIGDFTPPAAFRTAIEDVRVGAGPRPLHVAVLVASAVLSWIGAARFFRSV